MARAWPGWNSKNTWFRAVGYRPSKAQLPIHQSPARHLLGGGGWRGGKSLFTAAEAYGCWPRWNLLYIVGDKYENCLAEFDYLDYFFYKLEQNTKARIVTSRQRPTKGQSRCSLQLSQQEHIKRVITISTHNAGPSALTRRGEAPDMVLLVEMEGLDYDIWLAARGRVAQTRGRVIISGKFPDDTGWQAQMWRRWKGENTEDGAAFSLATWSNLAVFPGGRDDPEIKAIESLYSERDFMRDYGAEPQKPPTLVIEEFEYATHVKDWVDFEPRMPAEVWIDPGYGESAYAVLAVQMYSGRVWVVDEIYKHGWTGEEMVEEAKRRAWWGKVNGGVIDFAGRQHHAAKSQVEVWQAIGEIHLRSQLVPLEAGRDRLKNFLLPQPETGEPRLLFSPKVKQTAGEFGKYVWRDVPDERLASAKPIDRYCDGIKALCYGLIDHYGPVDYPSLPVVEVKPREQAWREAYNIG